ncbi:MAG TPA: DUF2071 domain-containing protein [Tepidisphaeraceae bacterium]|nr:DUF2071 domain-containing protein [Tepidisphaeraceae bacterium]
MSKERASARVADNRTAAGIRTDRRPWPTPSRPWAMRMDWHELLFMHWKVPSKLLRPHVPQTLNIEVCEGFAWVGVVPFRMTNVRPRFVPPVPGMSAFPELNVRTYVVPRGTNEKPGVWFFSLDATNPLAVRVARWSYHLPYFDARISCNPNGGVNTPTIHYSSRRTHKGAPPAELDMDYRPTGKVFHAERGSLGVLPHRALLLVRHAPEDEATLSLRDRPRPLAAPARDRDRPPEHDDRADRPEAARRRAALALRGLPEGGGVAAGAGVKNCGAGVPPAF